MSRPVPGTWEQGEPPPVLHFAGADAFLRELTASGARSAKAYTMGACRIIVAREPAGVRGELLWHLTISHERRHPTWDEIKAARYRLLPLELCFGLLLPPPQLYVNVPAQDHVFHLWEVDDERKQWTTG